MNQTTILATLGQDIISFNETNVTIKTLLDIQTAIENTNANINKNECATLINEIAKAILRADIALI